MFSQAVALFCMTRTTDPALLLAACAAYGFSVGNIITLPSLIMQREFPPASFGMVLGLVHRDRHVHRRARPRADRPDPRRDRRLRRGAHALHGAEDRGRGLRAGAKALTPSRSFRGIPQTRAAFIKFLPQSGRHIQGNQIPQTGAENACGHREIPPPDRAPGDRNLDRCRDDRRVQRRLPDPPDPAAHGRAAPGHRQRAGARRTGGDRGPGPSPSPSSIGSPTRAACSRPARTTRRSSSPRRRQRRPRRAGPSGPPKCGPNRAQSNPTRHRSQRRP